MQLDFVPGKYLKFIYFIVMRLVRFLLRYYPPGIILEYEQGSQTRTRTIDLLDLTERSNIYELVAQLQANEPLITPSKTDQVNW